MADPDYVFTDGFDIYGAQTGRTVEYALLTDIASLGKWTGRGGASADRIQARPPLTTTKGYSLTMGNNVTLYKVLPSTYARVIGGFHIYPNTTAGYWELNVYRSSGANLCAKIRVTGSTTQLTAYNASGTLVGTSATLLPTNTTHSVEFDITQHASAGIIKVWIDGVQVLNLTGLNTGSAGMDYLQFATPNSGTPDYWIDHFYTWWFTAGGGSETPALTNPVIQTDVPSSTDTQEFDVVSIAIGELDMVTNTSAGANRVFVRRINPIGDMTLTGVRSVPSTTSAGAKFKAVLYADSGGAPGALIATGTEVTGCTSGSVLSCPFASGQALTGGTAYWIGYITDTSIQTRMVSTASSETDSGYYAQTYASGPADPAGALTTGYDLCFWGYGTVVANNADILRQILPYTGNSVQSDVVGEKDLFGFPALDYTPSAIYGVELGAYAQRSDASAKTMDLLAKSGGTEGSGMTSGITPGTTLQHVSSVFLKNPDTAAAWVPSGLTAAKFGYKVAS